MKIEKQISMEFNHVVELTKHSKSKRIADDVLCEWAAKLMKEKLNDSREKGRHGWYDNDVCTIDDLRVMLTQAIDKGDMTDVMNFAAMIKARECAKQQ